MNKRYQEPRFECKDKDFQLKVEIKNDKNGNPMKITKFDTGETVFVNSKYDVWAFEDVKVGVDFQLTKDGNFNKLVNPNPPINTGGSKAGMMTKIMKEKQENISQSMDRKELGIKIASCNRMATDILVSIYPEFKNDLTEQKWKEKWNEIRSYLFNNWELGIDTIQMEVPFSCSEI